MPEPIIVYLDTSDYSRLADVGHRENAREFEPVLDSLRQYFKDRVAIFPYSYFHLCEILKYDFGHRDLAIRKAKLMTELSGGISFRYSTDIYDLEVRNFHKKKIKKRKKRDDGNIAISKDGIWFPEIDELPSLKKQMAQSFGKEIEHMGLSPNVKKKLRRMFLNKGELSANSIRFLASLDGEFHSEVQSKFPVGNSFYEKMIFRKYLLGQIKEREFVEVLFGGILEPENFVANYFEEREDVRKLFSGFVELEREFKERLVGSQKNLLVMKEEADRRGMEINFNKKFRENSYGYSATKLQESEISGALLREMANGIPHPILKSISAHLMIQREYLLNNMMISNVMRKIRESDAGDLFHSFYIPYSDIFRADGYFANLVGKHGAKFNCLVLDKLEKLPEAIEKRVEGQGIMAGQK